MENICGSEGVNGRYLFLTHSEFPPPPFFFPSLHPGDLYPFTRKPLFVIVDSSNSVAYKVSLFKVTSPLEHIVYGME